MGVRGLTSYIARNAEFYLQPYELHDCDLVIDGDSLACCLYKGVPECNSAFGGDYDIYYRTVKNFFEILFKCNIRPFVLLDGGCEQKKMRTIEKRLRSKISAIKRINPANGSQLFPLMMRGVFLDAVRDSGGVMIMRCFFEADDELAILARKLNCPLLSYDSDFYIHNVKYIPSVTLTLKVLEKKESAAKCKNNLSHTRARNIEKRMIANKPLQGAHWIDNSGASSKQRTIRYLDCCVYTIENLISNKRIPRDILPVFAALLGNDYIQASIFRQFFSHIGMKGISTKMTNQQRRIRAILKWLRHETKESAIEKILSRMKKEHRGRLLAQIRSATDGYNIEKSIAFDYFGLNEEDYRKSSSEDEDKLEGAEEDVEEDEESEEEEEEDEEGEEEEEEIMVEEEKRQEEEEESESEICSENEHEESEVKENGTYEKDAEEVENSSEDEDEQAQALETSETEAEKVAENEDLPMWFQQRIRSGDLPRFLVDLLHLNLYINNPQIENFLFEDCNVIAIPILTHIYALMTYPESIELRYLTRVVRLTNVHYKRLKPSPSYAFDPFAIDLNAIKVIFSGKEFQTDELFKEIEKIPSHLRLYFLAIVYWTTKSHHIDILHLYSLIICLVVLSTIDERYAEVRNPKIFYKKFGKFIQSFKKNKEKVIKTIKNENSSVSQSQNQEQKLSKAELTIKKAEEMVKNLPPEEKIKYIPKITSALVQERLLKYLNIAEDFRKRHNDFSSTIIHGFSEFQSIISMMNALNALVNKPYESTKMSNMYSGIFLYNLYTSLRARTDIEHFIENYIFKDSRIMFDYYKFLIEWCKKFVPFLRTESVIVKKSKRRSKKKVKKEVTNLSEIPHPGADMIEQDSDLDTTFNDVNNKFCSLLNFK